MKKISEEVGMQGCVKVYEFSQEEYESPFSFFAWIKERGVVIKTIELTDEAGKEGVLWPKYDELTFRQDFDLLSEETDKFHYVIVGKYRDAYLSLEVNEKEGKITLHAKARDLDPIVQDAESCVVDDLEPVTAPKQRIKPEAVTDSEPANITNPETVSNPETVLTPKTALNPETASKLVTAFEPVILPDQIEKRSFEIIGEELRARGFLLPIWQRDVTMRVIHTTADFDYAMTLAYSADAVKIARDLIRQGANIVTDTNMTKAGINKKRLSKFGGQVHCFMAEEDVAREAKERQMTRAAVSMERAAALPGPVIYAIGNAPTALMALHDMMVAGTYRPAFVIGVPVGFVNVVQAKELFLESDVPHIVNRGRKGGSNVAAAVCNALLYGMEE